MEREETGRRYEGGRKAKGVKWREGESVRKKI